MSADDLATAPRESPPLRRVVTASLIGSVIEWYDYIVYGTMAALIFNQLFFPDFDPAIGTILAFATFSIGFVARPLGGMVFGHFGDKLGRKSMLVTTLVMMGLVTFLIGLLPTYATIGIWAPIALVALRFVQGLAVGGEWGGATLMTMEYSPAGRRGYFSSLPQIGVPAGLLLSAGAISLLTNLMSDEQFAAWGWRLPFLFSAVLVGVGLFIRLTIVETPEFHRMKESGTEAKRPLVDVLRSHPRELLMASGTRVANNGLFYIMSVFVLSYGTGQLGLSEDQVLTGVMIGSAIGLVSIPAFGALSDRVGRRPVLLAGAVFMALFAFPLFWLMGSGSAALVALAVVLGINLGHDPQYSTQAAFICELFPTHLRYSGISLAYQLPSMVVGGLAPLVATGLVLWAGGESWGVSLYMIGLAIVTFVSVWAAPETLGRDQRSGGPQTAAPAAQG
jgi:MHS family shikimate/dehydroshikimate transporter-like MFS transporter